MNPEVIADSHTAILASAAATLMLVLAQFVREELKYRRERRERRERDSRRPLNQDDSALT
jgi:hypothetical protein